MSSEVQGIVSACAIIIALVLGYSMALRNTAEWAEKWGQKIRSFTLKFFYSVVIGFVFFTIPLTSTVFLSAGLGFLITGMIAIIGYSICRIARFDHDTTWAVIALAPAPNTGFALALSISVYASSAMEPGAGQIISGFVIAATLPTLCVMKAEGEDFSCKKILRVFRNLWNVWLCRAMVICGVLNIIMTLTKTDMLKTYVLKGQLINWVLSLIIVFLLTLDVGIQWKHFKVRKKSAVLVVAGLGLFIAPVIAMGIVEGMGIGKSVPQFFQVLAVCVSQPPALLAIAAVLNSKKLRETGLAGPAFTVQAITVHLWWLWTLFV